MKNSNARKTKQNTQKSSSIKDKISLFFRSLTVRLQACAIFLSAVGLGFGLKVYITIYQDFGAEAAHPYLISFYVQIGVAVFANIIVAFVIQRICKSPIQSLTKSMVDLTKGKLDIDVPYTDVRNEIGTMARRVNVFKKNAIEKIELEQLQAQRDQQNEIEKNRMLNEMANDFEVKVGNAISAINEMISHFDKTSDTLSTIVSNTSEQSEKAAEAVGQTMMNMQAVTKASHEVGQSIQGVGRQTQDSLKLVESVVDVAHNANNQVEELSKSMVEITEITAMIQKIAEQTNLLALNATIEAARAGDAGKGFAVVANEVKGLAAETAQATEDISNHIEELQSQTRHVVEAMENITSNIKNMEDVSQTIAKNVEEEEAAIGEIVKSVQGAAQLSEGASQNIEGVLEATEQTNDVSQQVQDAVEDLSKLSKNLNRNVEAFLEGIRPAEIKEFEVGAIQDVAQNDQETQNSDESLSKLMAAE